MKVVKKIEGQPYDAKGHFGVWSARKLAAEKDSQVSVSLSHFLPQGGAEMSSSPKERVYFIISGSMVVKGKTEEYSLNAGDLIYIAAGEDREIQVPGPEPVTILVIIVGK
ncbi:MAG: cupin domain-containing protein [Deltaproteobacteria bacterium]|nr:cupin domain-containing protein [Deltaproteobacteria bacterium]MBW2301980.1 cupin domain-containing protein [Deltaproteobacteria bacterium]